MDPFVTVLHKWLFDPVVGRMVTTLICLIVLNVILRFMHRSLEVRFATEARYRSHKIIKSSSRCAMSRTTSVARGRVVEGI